MLFIKQRPRLKLRHEFYLLETDWARSPIRGTDLACYLVALLCYSFSPPPRSSRFVFASLFLARPDCPYILGRSSSSSSSSLLSVRPSCYLWRGELHFSPLCGEFIMFHTTCSNNVSHKLVATIFSLRVYARTPAC